MAEKEYIERKALQNKAFGEEHPTFYDGQDIADWYEKCINETPAADVAPVVRCKDCIYSSFVSHCSKYECGRLEDILFFSDDFCSYGKRKENYNG